MKKAFLLIINAVISISLYSQSIQKPDSPNFMKIQARAESKVLSGKLFETIRHFEESPDNHVKSGRDVKSNVILYFEGTPANDQIQELENLGVTVYFDTWTPPMENHKYGFLVAAVPVTKLQEIIELPGIKKIDTAERSSQALNNTAALSVKAPMVWAKGNTGKGVKICILDSGIDITYAGSDLPASFQSKDYSYFPLLDDNVANTVTGHGTHVAATALGRGVLSEGHNHWSNGKGAFKGMAPDADLVFIKIGEDEDAVAEDPAVIAAIDAAINIYHVDIISMSYGGWGDYHDGSSAMEQKADWAYSRGVPFFGSAGNDGELNKHWMGKVPANSESDFIEIKVSDPEGDTTMLRFNMVWFDGTKRTDLTLKYYDSSKNPLNEVSSFPSTESLRGTESRYSYYEFALSEAGTYYLKVFNNSSYAQEVHLYEDWGNQRIGTDHVTFTQAEPSHTIGSPSSADHAFSVGAYVSKTVWTNPQDKSFWWGPASVFNNITTFSSIGPTMDGRIKPDICGPGQVLLSLRDKDVYQNLNNSWIDNDGLPGGEANYYTMRGTSMACPVVSGSAALYLEKYPNASPKQIYDAFKNFSNQSGLSNLPNNTWGSGRLDIYSAIQGARGSVIVDGNMNDEKYTSLAKYTSNRDGYGNKNNLGEIKYYSDGENLYIGVTGEVTGNDNILLFMDFSGVQGRGTNPLGGGNSGDFVDCAFAYMGNVLMDFDIDFALGFNKENSTQFEFFTDAIRYGTENKAANIGKSNQMGASSIFEIGSLFGGTGFLTMAYDSSYSINNSKGIEVKIPISALAGVDTSQTLRLFAVISSRIGDVSNECIPGDPGPDNLGDGADFRAIPDQDFFTGPVKISAPKGTTFVLSNESPGYLIDKLISAGYGNSNLYDVLSALKPTSGGVISAEFLATLAGCPAGSEIFTAALSNFAGLNNPVCVNSDGTLKINPLLGSNFYGKEGFLTFGENQAGLANELFTYATGPDYYINAGFSGTSVNYKAFAIAWSRAAPTKPLTVTAKPGQSKEHGTADPVFTYTVSPGLDSGDSFTGALSREPGEDPGTYAITLGTLSAGTKYAISFVSADFTITANTVTPTTFVLSNEAPGYLIASLIAAGFRNSSLYEVLEALKPASGGVISDEFLAILSGCPEGSEIFSAALKNFAGQNNPVGINSDGTLMITGIYGNDFYKLPGYETVISSQTGVGPEFFTYATGSAYYINTGVSIPDGTANYQVFAIAWSNPTDAIPGAEISQDAPYVYPNPFTDGLYIMNLKGSARIKVYDIMGQSLFQTEKEGNGFIALSELSNGIYWLRISADKYVVQQKIVKE